MVARKKIKLLSSRNLRTFFKKINIVKLVIFLVAGGLVTLAVLASRYLVVAWVDNKPITRLEYFQALDQKYGSGLIEQLIVERLVMQEALKRVISVSNEEIEAEIKKIEEGQGGKDNLGQILQVQGISQSEFYKLVRLQLLKQKMFDKDVVVTEEDVKTYLESQNQTLTIDDQQRKEITSQLKLQKINNNFNNWLREALQSSRVKRV